MPQRDNGRPTVYGLVTLFRKETNDRLKAIEDRLGCLEQKEYARTRVMRVTHAVITLVVGIAGVLAGLFLKGGN